MAATITIAGENLIAQKAQNNEALNIDTFIFANVPGQDENAEIDRNETVPELPQQVHTQVVQQVGRINDNVVVYSTVLDSVTGTFDFNWVGLYSSESATLIGINHVPTTTKTHTTGGTTGNTLNRNFSIQYAGIAEITGVVVDPQTWQLDFTARLNGVDELNRKLGLEILGDNAFIENGFKVEPHATENNFNVLPGAGYISGHRVELALAEVVNATSYPKNIFVDAYFQGDASSTWAAQNDVIITSEELSNYVDEIGKQHYLLKIAIVTAADQIEDLRKVKDFQESLQFNDLEEMKAENKIKIGSHLNVGDANFIAQAEETNIALQNGLYAKTRGSTVLMSWLNKTGETDPTQEIEQLLNAGFKVKLPAGIIGKKGTTLNVPSGSVLLGSGAPRYDDKVVDNWDYFGTVTQFEIDLSGAQSCALGNFSIDSSTDGIRGYGKSCGNHYIRNVNTKAVTHGHIYALFLTAAEKLGSADPLNNVVGNIIVEDCEHWGGANGFITKHDSVQFIKCKAYDCTTQAFACAADNINGAQVFHTARFNKFIDCIAVRCFISYKVYSRDEFSSDGSAGINTNGVIPAYDTQFIGCMSYDTTVYPILIGDDPVTANSSRALLTPELVKIDNLPYQLENPGFIRVQRVNGCAITRCEFKAGNNVVSDPNYVSGLIIDDSNSVTKTSTGDEVNDIIISNNENEIKLHKWCPNQRVRIQNTLATTISSADGVDNHKYNFVIEEDFTKLFIFGGQGYSANGVDVKARLVNGAWAVNEAISSTRTNLPTETIFTETNTVSIDVQANRSNCFYCNITAGVNGISIANESGIQAGELLTLDLRAGAAARAIGSWSSIFIFKTAKPNSIAANASLLVQFMKIIVDGNHRFIEISRHEYLMS